MTPWSSVLPTTLPQPRSAIDSISLWPPAWIASYRSNQRTPGSTTAYAHSSSISSTRFMRRSDTITEPFTRGAGPP